METRLSEELSLIQGQVFEGSFGFKSLFNFEGVKTFNARGCSSAGRAPALQAGGHRFEPVHLHQGEWRAKHRDTGDEGS